MFFTGDTSDSAVPAFLFSNGRLGVVNFMERIHDASLGMARVVGPKFGGIGVHPLNFRPKDLGRIAEFHGVAVGFRHFPAVEARHARSQTQNGFGFRKNLSVKTVESSGNFLGAMLLQRSAQPLR